MFLTWVVIVGLIVALVRQSGALRRLQAQLADHGRQLQALRRDQAAPGAEAPAVVQYPVSAAPTLAVEPLPQREAEPPPFSLTAPRRKAPAEPRAPLSERLSERGLAWLGSAGLALGAALLVGYMAEQGLLTPLVRLIAATLLGLGLLGASEWVRRSRREEAGPVIAALTAGAGAATLYAVIWAAHGIYGYVGAGVAGGLLAAVAGMLLVLSLAHGRPLGLLALGGAYAVPLVTGGPTNATWGGSGVVVFVLSVLAAGVAVSVRRGWAAVASLAVGGALLWGAELAGPAAGARSVIVVLAAAVASWNYAVLRGPGDRRARALAGHGPIAAAFVLAATAAAGGGDQQLLSLGLLALAAGGAVAWRRRLVGAEMFAVLVVVAAVGLLIASGARPADALVQSALVGLALLLAGYGDLRAEHADDGRLARWRARGLLLVGGATALVSGAVLSPWWGGGGVPRVAGPPVFDSLLLAYLAPAGVAALAAARLYRSGERGPARVAVLAGATGLVLWLLHAVRRAFDGPVLATGGVGMHEAAVYALVALALPLLFAGLGRLRPADPLRRADLEGAGALSGWAALVLAAVVLGLLWNPWWGWTPTPFGSLGGLLAMLLAYPAAAGLSLSPARVLGRSSGGLRAAGQVSAVLQVFLGLNLAIRASYRGLDLRLTYGETGLETWTYSAAWALLGVAVLTLGTRRGEAALRWCGLALVGLAVAKVLVFDMATLSGVTRAGSFLAVGALLLAGALLLKRPKSRAA